MSRFKNFTYNLGAGYIQLVFNAIYSLISIPLILHFLPKEQFGLWATIIQLMGYITLVDFGMTSASARLLVDHKDDRSNGNYGSVIQTTFLVSAIQGLIVFILCVCSAPLITAFIKVPAEQVTLFTRLLAIQGIVAASGFIFRPFSVILYAYQKEYIPVLTGSISLLISLPILWFLLAKKIGIYSFVYVSLFFALVTPITLLFYCWKCGYLPKHGESTGISKKTFIHVFDYGKDIFLMNMGAQLINASQLVIISRCLGLEKAAIWAIGTKIFYVVISLVCRPYGAAIPGLSELLVRGDNEKLYKRFREIVVLTCSLGVFFGVSYALCNSLFVSIWTHGKINWSSWNDLFLGFWVILSSMQTTHGNFVSVTKRIEGMRYIYFAEGVCFFLVGLLSTTYFGILGVIIASLICTILFSYQYSIRRSSNFFQCNIWDIAVLWILPSLKYATAYIPIAIVCWFSTKELTTLHRFELNIIIAVIIGGILLIKIGLTNEIKKNLIQKIKKIIKLKIINQYYNMHI